MKNKNPEIAQKAADKIRLIRSERSHNGLFKQREFYVHKDDLPKLRNLEDKLRKKRIQLDK